MEDTIKSSLARVKCRRTGRCRRTKEERAFCGAFGASAENVFSRRRKKRTSRLHENGGFLFMAKEETTGREQPFESTEMSKKEGLLNRLKAYWIASAKEFSDPKKLAFAGVTIALSVALQSVSIPLNSSGSLFIQITFWLSALSGIVCGPLLAMTRGALADIVGAVLFPQGAFYFGYTLSAMLAALVYSLFLWGRKVKISSLLLSKLIVNVCVNALLGSCWNHHILGSRYMIYFSSSVVKNLLLYPLEMYLLVLLFRGILPVMAQMKMIDGRQIVPLRFRWWVAVLIAVAALLFAVFVYFFGADVFKALRDFLRGK